MMRNGRITQKMVGDLAGVSQTMVSMVLNGTGVVADETRERVESAVKQLGYVEKKKNSTGRQRVLAYIRPVVIRTFHHEEWIYDSYEAFYGVIQSRLEEEAAQQGYTVAVRPHTDKKELTRWLMEWEVDGVFWHGQDQQMAQWIADRYPMVQLSRHMVRNADAVSCNQSELVEMGVRYLWQKGHRKILFPPVLPVTDPLRKSRNTAFLQEAEKYGLPTYEDVFDFKQPEKYRVLEEKIRCTLQWPEAKRPTAILIGDSGALLLMKQLEKAGKKIPEDFSILGMDNISAGRFVYPELSSLDTCSGELGQRAVHLMIDRIQNPKSSYQKILLSPELIERASVQDLCAKKAIKNEKRHQKIQRTGKRK